MDRGSIMTLAAFTQLPAGDLVLASASSIRAKILHDAGLGYRCYPVAIDEESVRASASAEAVPVGDIAVMLAEMKAAAAVQRLALESDPSPAFVLGCDQILACDEVIYSKPQDHAMAKAQLMAFVRQNASIIQRCCAISRGRADLASSGNCQNHHAPP
jgi:septum formation protein